MIFDFLQVNWFEIVAAILAIAYLILAMLQDIRCWVAWIISSLMYFFVMYSANLYMEALLQIFYIFIGLYGLYQWRFKADKKDALKITTWSVKNHLIVIGALVFLTSLSGYVLMIYTAAASPFIDAFTTWGAIAASYLVAKKILENWFYWFVIDFVSVFLFISRELYPTALLFIVYLVLVVIGYSAWRKSWQLADE
jgi:nicotinamide mononucleotide transporter|tara:strand:+ start:485 stop:1072 length:588 start_codon:yes stop_codon:yes gene_type:complete